MWTWEGTAFQALRRMCKDEAGLFSEQRENLWHESTENWVPESWAQKYNRT